MLVFQKLLEKPRDIKNILFLKGYAKVCVWSGVGGKSTFFPPIFLFIYLFVSLQPFHANVIGSFLFAAWLEKMA